MCNRYEILLKCDLFVCQTLRTVSEGYRMLSAVTTLMSQISGDINTSQRLISFPRYPVEVATNPREDSLRTLINTSPSLISFSLVPSSPKSCSLPTSTLSAGRGMRN